MNGSYRNDNNLNLFVPSRSVSVDENNNNGKLSDTGSPSGVTPIGSGVFLFPPSASPPRKTSTNRRQKIEPMTEKPSLLISVHCKESNESVEMMEPVSLGCGCGSTYDRFSHVCKYFTEHWLTRVLWDVVFIFTGTSLGIANLITGMKHDWIIGKFELALLINSLAEPNFHFFVIGPAQFFPDIIERLDYTCIWLNFIGAIISTIFIPSPYFKVIGMLRTIKGFRHFFYFGMMFINYLRQRRGLKPYLYGEPEVKFGYRRQQKQLEKAIQNTTKEISMNNYKGQDVLIKVELKQDEDDLAQMEMGGTLRLRSGEEDANIFTGNREVIVRVCYGWRLLYWNFPKWMFEG